MASCRLKSQGYVAPASGCADSTAMIASHTTLGVVLLISLNRAWIYVGDARIHRQMRESIEEVAADALWWVGWRPFVTAGFGAATGVVVGYFRGWIGLVTAATAVFLVALGVAKPLLLKAGFAVSAAGFVAFFVAGAERTKEAFESIGVETELAETVSVFLLEVAAFAGVEPPGEPTEVVGSVVAGLAIWSLAGASVGVVVWLLGAHTVNARHGGVLERLVGGVREEGEIVLGDDGSLHTLTHGKGSSPLVESAERYHVANVLVGESSLCLHYGSTVEMASQEVEMGGSTREVYYDQIVSVGYEGSRVRIGRTDGETIGIVASEKPVELMEAIEGSLQEYKARARSATEEGAGTTESSGVADEGFGESRGSAVDDATVASEEGAEGPAGLGGGTEDEGADAGYEWDGDVDGAAEEDDENEEAGGGGRA